MVQGGPTKIPQPSPLLRFQCYLYLPRTEFSALPHYNTHVRHGIGRSSRGDNDNGRCRFC